MSTDFRPKKIFGKFIHVSDTSLETKNTKTLVFFLGAGFCPFCAAERWPIIEALKNFGTWDNLLEDFSAKKYEKYLNIPTFNFSKAKYSSRYVEFQAVETTDRDFNPGGNGSKDPYSVLDNYNPDKIIPFTLINGQFMQAGCGYSPSLLEGLDHMKVREQLRNPVSPLGSSIKNEVSYITALICSTLDIKSEVCTDDRIKYLLKKV